VVLGLLTDPVLVASTVARTLRGRRAHRRAPGGVDWSWDLLDEHDDGSCAAGVLGRLVDKSLVAPDLGGDQPRYRLLETLRAYGAGAWTTPVSEQRCDRHAQHLVRLAADRSPQLRTDAQLDAVVAPEEGIDDLRARMEWLQERGEPQLLAQQAASLGWKSGPSVAAGAKENAGSPPSETSPTRIRRQSPIGASTGPISNAVRAACPASGGHVWATHTGLAPSKSRPTAAGRRS
jgi:hypothetical protein